MGIASRRCVGALEAAFPAGWAAMAAASSSAAATAGMEQAWAVHGQWHGYEALVAELVAALVAALMAALAAVRKAAARMPDSRKTGRLAACKHASGYYTVEYHMLSLCVAWYVLYCACRDGIDEIYLPEKTGLDFLTKCENASQKPKFFSGRA